MIVADKAANQPNPITRYFREVRGELRKVTWPTRQESQRLTAVVIAVTIAFAIFFWILDLIFSGGINALIRAFAGV
ncbi:MAG TPA: preprotein translocase subunit SecE [Anaerolineae bacterium]|nr:preprotein translocase subunit SecE [Anaerolineae bacterium]